MTYAGGVTYSGEVTYGDISVYWSHFPSHTVVQEKCHFLRSGKHELALLVLYSFACLQRLTFYTFYLEEIPNLCGGRVLCPLS